MISVNHLNVLDLFAFLTLPSGFVYIRVLSFWAFVLVVDFLLEFRLELLWPLWLFLTSVYDSFKYQGLVCSFTVCSSTVSSRFDVTLFLVCFFFPRRPFQYFSFVCRWWPTFCVSSSSRCSGCFSSPPLTFGYSTSGTQVPEFFINPQTVALTDNWFIPCLFSSPFPPCWTFLGAERGICLPTICLWALFIYVEASIRLKDLKHFPAHLDLCRPFAAHCIGYPVVTWGFDIKGYVSYRIRQVIRSCANHLLK